MLSADAFLNDPRVLEAKALILETLKDHQSKITGVKPANASEKITLDTLLKEFEKQRGNALFFPYVSSGLGHGPLVELKDGSIKYDLINGIGVHLGHSIPSLIEAAVEGALQDTVMQGNLQQNQASLEVMKCLTEQSGLDYVFLTSSGAMACENGLKILFQKQAPRTRLLAFQKCFMGRTLGLAQVTDKAAYREGLPPTLLVDYVPFYDAANHEKSIQNALDTLQNHIQRYPGQHAAMCMEMIQGEGGYYFGHPEFFQRIVTLLKQNNIAVMVDEVQTFCRTENMFAHHTFGLKDQVDVVTIGKNAQVCATLFKKEWKPRPGLISQTFTSSTTAIQTSVHILNTFISGGYFGPSGKINRLHQHFAKHLSRLANTYPALLKGPFGIGSMMAFTPFDGEKEKVLHFLHALYANGVIGFTAGQSPMRIRFLLPVFCLTEQQIDDIANIIESTLKTYA